MRRILGLSGSLRAASCNSALLRAAADLAPPGVQLTLFTGLGELALFNPDVEHIETPVLADFRLALRAADAVVIASPEYAHGVTGVLKNALDWVVGSGEFDGKPVALLNAAPRAQHAPASLREIITVMGARVVDAASLTVPLTNNRIDALEARVRPEVAAALQAMLDALANAVGAPDAVRRGSG